MWKIEEPHPKMYSKRTLRTLCSVALLFSPVILPLSRAQEIDYDVKDDMGQNENILPPDFNSIPFPNQEGFDPFSRNTQFNDPFRTPPTTEDPFRRPPPPETVRPILRSSTEVNFYQIQNNELPNQPRPINPIPQTPPPRNRARPQVDEFGNPLGKGTF